MSEDMAIEYLHSDKPEEIRERELENLKKRKEEEQQLAGRMDNPNAVPGDDDLAELGALLGGDNPENNERRGTNPLDAKERNDIPDITDYQEGKE